MKILKKIGIWCIALVICFCSCFKFVNAEMIEEPFIPIVNRPYGLVVRADVLTNDNVTIAYSGDDNTYLYYYYNNNDPYIKYFQIEGQDIININLTYLYSDNNYTYFKFVYPTDANPTDYYYEDNFYIYFDTTIEKPQFSVYDTIYNLVERYIFGGNIEKGSHQDLTAVTLSSIICVLVFALPFLIIWKVIKVIMG